jgi:hypothetical protein
VGLKLMEWLTFAAAVPGRPGHVCEDAALAVEDAVVVADGLGSTGIGARASRLAVDLALGNLLTDARSGTPVATLGELFRERYAVAVAQDRAVATTCLFAFATPGRVLVGQVGDGLAAVLRCDGSVFLLEDGRGVFANVTDSLPLVAPRIEAFAPDTVSAVLLATDGVADDLIHDAIPALVRALRDLLIEEGPVHAGERIREWLFAWKTRSSNDDRAVGLLVHHIREQDA